MKSKSKLVVKILVSVLLVVALLSVGLTFSLNKKSSSTNTSDTQEVEFSNMSMACIGDSITQGLCKGVAMEKPYCVVVKESLGLENVYNCGIGGATLSNKNVKSICNRYYNIPNDVDIITLLGGVNDWAQGVPLGTIDDMNANTIYGALNYIASNMVVKYSNAFIVFMSPLPVSDAKLEQYSSTPYSLADINTAYKNICKKYNIAYLDLYSLSGFENECNDAEKTDGVHPNADFHKNNIAPLLAQFIKDNYKK